MLKVTLIKSPIASLPVHKATVAALACARLARPSLSPTTRPFAARSSL